MEAVNPQTESVTPMSETIWLSSSKPLKKGMKEVIHKLGQKKQQKKNNFVEYPVKSKL
jgi:hypothetical protein